MPDRNAVLSVHDLACARGDRTLFCGLNFTLRAGQLLLVQGGNGRGKTSLLRLLCGLSSPLAGEVRWRAQRIEQMREDYQREMLYLGHANGIKDELTPLENLRLAAAIGDYPLSESEAERRLAELGLARCLDLPARVLSFGQRRRVALASLVAANRRLWILDEPLTGLDVHGVALVEDLLRRHVHQGGLVVMTTHQPLALDGIDLMPLRLGQEDAPERRA